MLNISIVGRPNVGKSSIFNKLTRSRNAIVHDKSGVTRDVIEGIAKIGESEFNVFDTAGIEKSKDMLTNAISDMAWQAATQADAIFFVVDGAFGLHPGDEVLAKEVRKLKKPVMLIVNKGDVKRTADNMTEFRKLGLGIGTAISAEHRLGFEALENWLKENFPNVNASADETAETPDATNNSETHEAPKTLKLAVFGQPNVGKSTLINKIIGEKRMLAFDMPGVTRDAVQIPFEIGGREVVLVDTPGLRRKGKVSDDLENLAAIKAIGMIEEIGAAVLVLDATLGIENYDLNIASRIVEKGKILAIALNKWDAVNEEDRDEKLLKIKHKFYNSFHQVVKPIVLPISAEKGTGVKNLLKRTLEAWESGGTQHATSKINRVVEKLVKHNPPPMSRLKRPMKIKFAAQTGTHPITITLFVNDVVELPASYERFLRNGISKEMGWDDQIVRILYRRTNNPYAE